MVSITKLWDKKWRRKQTCLQRGSLLNSSPRSCSFCALEKNKKLTATATQCTMYEVTYCYCHWVIRFEHVWTIIQSSGFQVIIQSSGLNMGYCHSVNCIILCLLLPLVATPASRAVDRLAIQSNIALSNQGRQEIMMLVPLLDSRDSLTIIQIRKEHTCSPLRQQGYIVWQ